MYGYHPTKTLDEQNADEARFVLTINDLMPPESTLVKKNTSDFNWNLGMEKKTLKELEKAVYYSVGDYKDAYTNKFAPNMLTGFIDMEK